VFQDTLRQFNPRRAEFGYTPFYDDPNFGHDEHKSSSHSSHIHEIPPFGSPFMSPGRGPASSAQIEEIVEPEPQELPPVVEVPAFQELEPKQQEEQEEEEEASGSAGGPSQQTVKKLIGPEEEDLNRPIEGDIKKEQGLTPAQQSCLKMFEQIAPPYPNIPKGTNEETKAILLDDYKKALRKSLDTLSINDSSTGATGLRAYCKALEIKVTKPKSQDSIQKKDYINALVRWRLGFKEMRGFGKKHMHGQGRAKHMRGTGWLYQTTVKGQRGSTHAKGSTYRPNYFA
jgi:hypothetical protein